MNKIKKFFQKLTEKLYERLDRKLVAHAAGFLGSRGRNMGSELTFTVLNPLKVSVFGAGLVIGEKSLSAKLLGQRVFWYGDLNLTDEMDNLVGLSRIAGDTIYVLSAQKTTICSIRSVGDDNKIEFKTGGVEMDLDGRYVVKKDIARDLNRSLAQSILNDRGWLPTNLIDFYGLKAPKPVRIVKRRAQKKTKKGNQRAKKRA